MRHLLLTLVLIPLFVQSQWITRSGSNKFDGNYKIAAVYGRGGEFPYTEPALGIVKYEDGEPSFRLTNIGYTGCGEGYIDIAFNDSDSIYSYETYTNRDKDIAFIRFSSSKEHDNSPDFFALIKLFKEKNKVFLRYENDCGKNDYEFSLGGSTKAIDFVAKEYLEKERLRIKEEKKLEELRLKEEKELAPIRAEIARKEQAAQRLLELEKEKKKVEKFEKDLLAAFQFGDLPMDQSLLKEIMPLKLTELTTTLRYCFKQDSKGRTFSADEQTFFSSDRLTLYNRIAGDCILITNGKWGGQFTIRYYIKINDLANNTDNPKIQVIKEKWDELVKLSTKN